MRKYNPPPLPSNEMVLLFQENQSTIWSVDCFPLCFQSVRYDTVVLPKASVVKLVPSLPEINFYEEMLSFRSFKFLHCIRFAREIQCSDWLTTKRMGSIWNTAIG